MDTAIKVAVEKESTKRENRSLFNWIFGIWNPSGKEANTEEPAEDEKSKGAVHSKNAYINEQAFLSLSWWLLNRGWSEFRALVTENVNKEFGTLNPRDKITVQEFSEKLTRVFQLTNKNLLNNNESILKSILLPEPSLEDFVLQQTLDPEALKILNEDRTILCQLLHETTKCIESTASSIVLETLINESFQYVMEQVEGNVGKKSKGADKSRNPGEADQTYQVAVFTIGCKDCCNDILKSGIVSMDNSFLSRLDSVVVLDDLSASVYSNFGFQD